MADHTLNISLSVLNLDFLTIKLVKMIGHPINNVQKV